jgi:hypothetical protein
MFLAQPLRDSTLLSHTVRLQVIGLWSKKWVGGESWVREIPYDCSFSFPHSVFIHELFSFIKMCRTHCDVASGLSTSLNGLSRMAVVRCREQASSTPLSDSIQIRYLLPLSFPSPGCTGIVCLAEGSPARDCAAARCDWMAFWACCLPRNAA